MIRTDAQRAYENLLQRERRKRDGNKNTKAYEKTPRGFLMRAYRNMKSRIEGVQAAKHHLYVGKELLDREAFYAWAVASSEFQALFAAWTQAGHPRTSTPSVDRKDSTKGYLVSNMEWVTHSENSRRGSLSQARQRRRKSHS